MFDSLRYIWIKFDKTGSFLAANYANFRGLRKKFALIREIRGKRFAMYSSKMFDKKRAQP